MYEFERQDDDSEDEGAFAEGVAADDDVLSDEEGSDFDNEDYWERMALQQEVGRQFELREEAEDDVQLVIEEKQEVIKDKQEEIYGESGYLTGFQRQTAELNRICEALDLPSGANVDEILRNIGELTQGTKFAVAEGVVEGEEGDKKQPYVFKKVGDGKEVLHPRVEKQKGVEISVEKEDADELRKNSSASAA